MGDEEEWLTGVVLPGFMRLTISVWVILSSH